jgi:hypothetical protein
LGVHAGGADCALDATVLSGDNIGFRVESRKGSTPVGRFVVRVDGKWVEAEFAPGLRLLTK